MKIKISNNEIKKLLNIKEKVFPKYTKQIINMANQNSQGTRPKIVGQMSDLSQEFLSQAKIKDINNWRKFYLENHPNAIKDATNKIKEMIDNLKVACNEINEEMIKKRVEDLIIQKTFIGLNFQEAILKKIANNLNLKYRLANKKEEAMGIDGYIQDIAVSIKPITYKTKNFLNEKINIKIIYYKKQKDGIIIEFDDLFK